MVGFVGRAVEQAQLTDLLTNALDGRGGLALLAGEPGIGKTTLCEQLVALAEGRGALVRWGRCPESVGAPPFWPWRQILDGWPADDADVDRFMFFEARWEAIRRLAAPTGAIVVLDDLHWADESSLRLLEHLAPSLRDSRALVVGTYRSTEVERGDALDRSLGTLARHATLLPVRGLQASEVSDLAQGIHGAGLSADAVAAITDHTNGNPFFVAQLVRFLESEGRADGARAMGVPPGVGEVVRRRVERLGADAAAVLARAAVVGRTVGPGPLRVVADGFDIEGAVNAGLAAGLIEADPTRPGSFRFVHALVREVLEADLGLEVTARVHEQLLHHLASTPAGSADLIAERAHHAVGAVSRIGPAVATGFVLAAGRAASEAGGFEEAVRLGELALRLDEGRRYESLVLLGRALFNVEDTQRSEAVLLEAADHAEQAGDGLGMARALLEIGGGRLVAGSTELIATRIGDALRLVDGDLAIRAELLSRKADMLTDPDEVAQAAREGFDLARRAGAPEALVSAGTRLLLNGSAWMRPGERRSVVDELMTIDDHLLGPDARMNRGAVALLLLLEEGRLDEAAEAAETVGANFERLSLIMRLREPVRILLALLRGRLDEAGELASWLAAETERRGAEEQVGPSNQARFIVLLRERDQIAMLAAVIAQLRSTEGPLVDPVLLDVIAAVVAAAATPADRDGAVHAIDVALGHDLERWALGWAGIGMTLGCLLADAALAARHLAAAARLAPIVAAVADRNVVLGMPPTFSLGWGAYYLGCCQLVQDQLDDAAASLEEALARNTAMGALPFVARTHLALATLRLAVGDGTGAVGHARAAHGIAVRSDLPALERLAAEQLGVLGAAVVVGDREAATTTFVFTDIVGSTAAAASVGDRVWRAGLDEHTSRVRALAVKHGGRLVKSLGDGFMVVFPTAAAGVAFALAVQDDVADGRFRVRVGVHTGEAEAVDGDFFGHHVNLAARVAGAADAGEVLVSDVVRTILSGSRDVRFDLPRTVDLKGIPDPQVLYLVVR